MTHIVPTISLLAKSMLAGWHWATKEWKRASQVPFYLGLRTHDLIKAQGVGKGQEWLIFLYTVSKMTHRVLQGSISALPAGSTKPEEGEIIFFQKVDLCP